MGEAAVAAARAVGYVGAGTVEFIVDTTDPRPDTFSFMELNTRLQVEHPVTEMVTGLDLVEWQLRVASGERLPLAQDALALRGHAIEARIYAEDPAKDFLPSVGRIAHLATPAAVTFALNASADASSEPAPVRIDSGIREGDEISQFYDPMIAKLIVWAGDRPAALRRMRAALAAFEVAGVATNVEFLHRLVGHRAFAEADLDTGLIGRNQPALLPAASTNDDAIAVAAVAEVMQLQHNARAMATASPEPHSPWHAINGWWLNQSNTIGVAFARDGTTHALSVGFLPDGGLALKVGGRSLVAHARTAGAAIELTLDGRTLRASVVRAGAERTVFLDGTVTRLTAVDPYSPPDTDDIGSGHLVAPMSGTIIAVNVKTGDHVAKGSALLILEAMKMEHTIAAPGDGIVEHVYFRAGEQVKEGAELVALAKPAA
jgi:3-methylcrotonyl-CoA carboxylase alpha subunit